MSRAERLLDLIQLLSRHRAPVTGPALADALGISIRTLYRDIATLQAQGAEPTAGPEGGPCHTAAGLTASGSMSYRAMASVTTSVLTSPSSASADRTATTT